MSSGAPRAGKAAAGQDGEPVGALHSKAEVVQDEDDGAALGRPAPVPYP